MQTEQSGGLLGVSGWSPAASGDVISLDGKDLAWKMANYLTPASHRERVAYVTAEDCAVETLNFLIEKKTLGFIRL